MMKTMLKCKIHRATVTDAVLHYEGSVTIDKRLMEAAEILPFERIQVLNVNNGHRVETYVIEGPAGSGIICLNGPTARLGQVGDVVILITYALMNFREASKHRPIVVYVDEKNKIINTVKAKILKEIPR